jgi:hypothetical protein
MEEFVDEQGKYETIQLAKKPVLEAEVKHINALIDLVKEGDTDAELLILAMYLEHSGDKATFVRHGIALGPYVDMALKAVTDRQLDVTSAIEKVVDVVDQAPSPPKEKPPKHEPGELRVEMTTENEHGIKVPNWVVRDDNEIYRWYADPDDAVAGLEEKRAKDEEILSKNAEAEAPEDEVPSDDDRKDVDKPRRSRPRA